MPDLLVVAQVIRARETFAADAALERLASGVLHAVALEVVALQEAASALLTLVRLLLRVSANMPPHVGLRLQAKA